MTTEQEKLIITKYDLLFESRLKQTETTMIHLEKEILQSEGRMLDAIKEVKYDIRWMFGIMLAFSTALLGLMAKGFHWL